MAPARFSPILLMGLVLSALPWIAPSEALAADILIHGLFAIGFNLMFGHGGLLSFGHAALFGAGAFGCGMAIVHLGWSWPAALLAGTALSGFVGAAMGVLAVRSKGIYFAMVTLALAEMVRYVFFQAKDLTGGENGLRGLGEASRFPIDPMAKYYIILAIVLPVLWLVHRLLRSSFGTVLQAVRSNEIRAVAVGCDVTRIKFLAFVVSALVSGLAGGLYALHLSVVPIAVLHYHVSGMVVMMALLGGMGTFFGPFIGAALMMVLEDVLSLATSHWPFFAGIIFIIFVLYFPKGVWGEIVERSRR